MTIPATIREHSHQNPLIISNIVEISALVDIINHRLSGSRNLEISALSANQFGHIKWLSPSLDYPSILSSYYLYPPFKISWEIYQNFVLPKITIAEAKGERPDLIDQVTEELKLSIIKYHQIPSAVL